MRKTYKVIIEETISDEFTVSAESEAEAVNYAIRQYKDGRLVLSPGNPLDKKIAVVNDDDETAEWISF